MTKSDAKEGLSRAYGERGYIVIAHCGGNKYKPGDIISDIAISFRNPEPIGIPMRVVCGTDLADFEAQGEIAFGPAYRQLNPAYDTFYRLEGD